MDLFVAADQFGVERLKKMCEKAILQSITVESAACAGKRGQGRALLGCSTFLLLQRCNTQ